MIADISTHEMFDVIEGAVNGTDFQQGKSDAMAHVGRMIDGAWTPEELSDIQDKMIPGENGVTAAWLSGYTAAWVEVKHYLL